MKTATVTLLMKEALVRVAEPALLPATGDASVDGGSVSAHGSEMTDDLDSLLEALPPEIADRLRVIPRECAS